MNRLRFTPPVGGLGRPLCLLVGAGTPGEQRFAFQDSIEIGRDEPGREATPGLLLVDCPTVSYSHCVITQRSTGHCVVRDLSRNGTRLDGRRLVPNVEAEVFPGQVIEVSPDFRFQLDGDLDVELAGGAQLQGRTVGGPGLTIVTVLVGDIRDYTMLVRRAPSAELQQSVGRVFEELSAEVMRFGGTVKEYQGDAIFAFWEGSFDGRQAMAACRAALALDRRARMLADDPLVWKISDFPLKMDWALATGPVLIDSVGTVQRAGLSMIGEAVVLAFRIEKFADDTTGRIIACSVTQRVASGRFKFSDLGEKLAKGFDRPDHVFALEEGDEGLEQTAEIGWPA